MSDVKSTIQLAAEKAREASDRLASDIEETKAVLEAGFKEIVADIDKAREDMMEDAPEIEADLVSAATSAEAIATATGVIAANAVAIAAALK